MHLFRNRAPELFDSYGNRHVSSVSYPAATGMPASRRPRVSPPAPQKRSTATMGRFKEVGMLEVQYIERLETKQWAYYPSAPLFPPDPLHPETISDRAGPTGRFLASCASLSHLCRVEKILPMKLGIVCSTSRCGPSGTTERDRRDVFPARCASLSHLWRVEQRFRSWCHGCRIPCGFQGCGF
jgi:hypothetical protein